MDHLDPLPRGGGVPPGWVGGIPSPSLKKKPVRNTGEIKELAGCDYLTISPALTSATPCWASSSFLRQTADTLLIYPNPNECAPSQKLRVSIPKIATLISKLLNTNSAP